MIHREAKARLTANEFLLASLVSAFESLESLDDAVRSEGPLTTRSAYTIAERLGDLERELQKLARKVQRGQDDDGPEDPARAPAEPPRPPPARKPERRAPKWPLLCPDIGRGDEE